MIKILGGRLILFFSHMSASMTLFAPGAVHWTPAAVKEIRPVVLIPSAYRRVRSDLLLGPSACSMKPTAQRQYAVRLDRRIGRRQ